MTYVVHVKNMQSQWEWSYKMTTIDRDTAKQYIYKTNGKIFSVVFTKKNGEKRKMGCRQGVAKYVKGVGLKFKPVDPSKERDLILVYDMHYARFVDKEKAYRFINVKTLEEVKIKGINYQIKESK